MHDSRPGRGPMPAPGTLAGLIGYGVLASLVGGLVGGFAPWQSLPARAVTGSAAQIPAIQIPAAQTPAAHSPATEVSVAQIPAVQAPVVQVPAVQAPALQVPAPAVAAVPVAAERAEAVRPAVPPAPRAPTAEAGAAVNAFEPVIHARKAGIGTCMGSVVAQSRRVIDAQHAALSIWNTREPDRGTFQSILALRYENALAPNGAAILTAAPDGASRCGGTVVQVYPTARSCGAIQAELVKSGTTAAALLDLPLLAAADGTRELLLPTAGGGCVIVATSLE
ncbi:hypothetical protein Q8W71_13910 [Methylobacterium sp. NEAU 140]|uniref:hypothetical protein n=1 Tax=Methylobacterium sp. NEAU 140 TaxID=3064945 RepID=UPI00273363B6|nr:hypothetical protein [Methylobacterium sp. NEAU 140]MDP4023727.1 hypothetical protein [Methylobacterium sp. NEAU 140]